MKKTIVVVLIGVVVLLSACSGNYQDDMGVRESVTSPMYQQDLTSGESYKEITENPFISVSDMQVSTFGADVDTASYSNIRRFLLNENSMPYEDAVRIEEMVNYFEYDLNMPNDDEVFGITTEIGVAPWNSDHQLLMIGLTTEEIVFDDVPANNLVFLLDTSGSMNDSNKLPLLISSIKMLVDNLRPIDRISIVTYAGSAGLVLDGADSTDREDIFEALDSLSAGGSTAGGEGINLAYDVCMKHFIEGGNNRVILGTDGDFNVGVSSNSGLERLITEKKDNGIFLSVLGFGTGNLQDDKMETLADKGDGVYYYIDSLLEAKKVFVSELGSSLVTVAKDVKLQVEFNPMHVSGYRLIGYENRVLSYDDFNDDNVDSGDIGAGHEVVAFYEIIPAGSDEEIDPLEFEKVEELKYDGIEYASEYASLSMRYKNPGYDESELLEHVIDVFSINDTNSESFVFASCVVEFGLLLRNSEYRGYADYDKVLERAESVLGSDLNGYRMEFLELVRKANEIDNR